VAHSGPDAELQGEEAKSVAAGNSSRGVTRVGFTDQRSDPFAKPFV